MKKKIYTILLSSLIILGSGSLTLAGNTTDIGYSFYFTRPVVSTEKREKRDKTQRMSRQTAERRLPRE